MKLTNLIKVFVFSLLLLGVPAIASAQWGGGNGGYGNGGYGNGGYNNGALKATIRRVQNQARQLENAFDHNGGGGRYGGYDNGGLENLTDRFKNAADDLQDEFGNGRNLNNSYDEASRLIQLGQQIDRMIGGNNGGRGGRGGYGGYNSGGMYAWNSIRNDLRTIANVYGIRYDNRGGGYGNGRGRGNGRGNRPF